MTIEKIQVNIVGYDQDSKPGVNRIYFKVDWMPTHKPASKDLDTAAIVSERTTD